MSEPADVSSERRLREQAWKIGYLHAMIGQKDRALEEAQSLIGRQSIKLSELAARVATLEFAQKTDEGVEDPSV